MTYIVTVCYLVVLMSGISEALSIVHSKHDFSPGGGGSGFAGNFKTSSTITEICVFCHTPHNGSSAMGVLWNRTNPANPFDPYTSSTLNAVVGAPTGKSLMCMSCHDGITSIAVNTLLNAPGSGNPTVSAYSTAGDQLGDVYYLGNIFTDGGWDANIGELVPGDLPSKLINMKNDHPVSFNFDAAMAADSGIKLPNNAELLGRLGIAGNRRLECSTCHNVHDPAIEPFLVMSNDNSAMCLQCHNK